MPIFRTKKCGAQGDEVDHLVDFFYDYKTGLWYLIAYSLTIMPEKLKSINNLFYNIQIKNFER